MRRLLSILALAGTICPALTPAQAAAAARAKSPATWQIRFVPQTGGTCKDVTQQPWTMKWTLDRKDDALSVKAVGGKARFPTLTGKVVNGEFDLFGPAAKGQRQGKQTLLDALHVFLGPQKEQFEGNAWLLSYRKVGKRRLVPCLQLWAVFAAKGRAPLDYEGQAMALVDKMAAKMEEMMRLIEAAKGDVARIKAIGEEFKKFAEANKAEGERLNENLEGKAKDRVDAYARKKMAPLMGRFMKLMVKHGPADGAPDGQAP